MYHLIASARWWLMSLLAGALSLATTLAAPTPRPKPTTTKPKAGTKPAAKKPVAKARVVMPKRVTPNVPASPVVDPESARFSTINGLGMRFVPVGDVEMAVWPVRVRDYAVFAAEVGALDGPWRRPSFPQTPEHPVVNLTWKDASRFCEWLTARERAAGRLAMEREYRLPFDAEWSRAAGLSEEPGALPAERDLAVEGVFPWGKAWPPPVDAGNFLGSESGEPMVMEGWVDAFPRTSPVGAFAANPAGLHDMAGNVMQWVRDPWAGESRERTLRGSSWYSGVLPMALWSSARVRARYDLVSDCVGFRVVIAELRKK